MISDTFIQPFSRRPGGQASGEQTVVPAPALTRQRSSLLSVTVTVDNVVQLFDVSQGLAVVS